MAGITTKGAAYLAIASICGVTAGTATVAGFTFGTEILNGIRGVAGTVQEAPTTDAGTTGTTIPK